MLTAEFVRLLLHYDPTSGRVIWVVPAAYRIKPGMEAGSIDRYGYRQIRIRGRVYRLHRVIWLYVYGRWPNGEIDHIDRDRSNNRLSNLREATTSQNQANKIVRSQAGLKGAHVDQSTGKWRSRIVVRGEQIHLGCFATAEEAAIAYQKAAIHYFGEFARF